MLALGDVAGRSKEICRIIAILGELEGALNHSAGGSLSRNLARLYQYMRQRLTQANLDKSDGPLAEVESLLVTLGEGWKAISPSGANGAAMPANQKPFGRLETADIPAVAYASQAGHSTHIWTA